MKGRILVVEDEAFIAFYLDTVLKESGCDVIGPFDNALEAIRAAQHDRPDVAILDVQLKGTIDGITAARHFAEQLGVPIIIVSANAGQAATALRPFTQHILGKPVASEELVAAVHDALAGARHWG